MGLKLKDAPASYHLFWSAVLVTYAALQIADGMARVRDGEPFGADKVALAAVALVVALFGIAWPLIRRLRSSASQEEER